MVSPRSVRLDSAVETRLASYVARHPGRTSSSVAARFIDEGLRMDEHPDVHFRDGAAGRRASLIAGPDVWEVIRAVRSARQEEPDLNEAEVLDLVEGNSGLASRFIRSAIAYWAQYPDEVDAHVAHSDLVDEQLAQADERARSLLTA